MEFISNTIQIVVFTRTDNGIKYLLLKRSPYDDVYPGIWQICTGTREEYETPIIALFRELEEETGISSYLNVWNVPFVATYHSIKQNAICFSPVFAIEVSDSTVIRISQEHTDYMWANLDTAIKMMYIPSYKTSLSTVDSLIINPETSHLFLIKL